jgi:hypothetical protein
LGKEMKKMMIVMMVQMMKQNNLQPFSNLKAFNVNDKPSLRNSSDIQLYFSSIQVAFLLAFI